ncbi:MAG TPA: LytTR family DNA-binding domain-containing protein [Puia sp.]|nr:LytTR family DNA-binding domain-containing protein [Puia sp.]
MKKGIDLVTIKTTEIAYCYSAYKLVFLIEHTGQKFIVDRSLNDLEKELDPGLFFRVNRKYLVNIHHVRRIKALVKGKLSLDLNPATGEEIVISQERAPAFKIWMGN